MKEFRNKLIQDLYGLNVNADITIEELADDIIEDIQNIVGRDYVKIFGSCPINAMRFLNMLLDEGIVALGE